ncbi:MAG: MoxR family ATPase [Fervidobacterium sp.]|uniref:MoxR family ATPase n=1 Tax=Fervidobacterium sp. TaxID=1871331 RepID=UPI0030981944
MRIREFVQVLPRLMAMSEPVLIIGHAGVGKTTIVNDVAKSLGKKVKTVILSQMEPGDLLGLPIVVNGRTMFTRPEWLPPENESGWVIFLDELNRAPLFLRQGIMQLLTEKRVGVHSLPEDVCIVAAANPLSDDYQVEDMNDRALLTRFVIIHLESDPESLRKYLLNKGFPPHLVRAAIETLEEFGVFTEFAAPTNIVANPRAFERALRIYQLLQDMPQEVVKEVLSGIVGQQMAGKFIGYLEERALRKKDFFEGNVERIQNVPSIERVTVLLRIMENPDEVRLVKPEVLSLMTQEELAMIIRNVSSKPEVYVHGFLTLREIFPDIKELYSAI